MKRILVSIVIMLSIIGCGRETITEDQKTEVLINVQLPVFAPALAGLSQITAIVEAGPQDETVIAQGDLTITGSKATGTLMVLAGSQRVFILDAKDSDGQVIGSGQTTADVIAGQTITLDMTIEFRTGVVVINAGIPEWLPTFPGEDVFFAEDFSGYADGQSASEWGGGLTVSVDEGTGTHYLCSEPIGKICARKSIAFPDSFSFRFDAKLIYDFSSVSFKLRDSEGQLFPMRFETRSGYVGGDNDFVIIWYDEEGKEKDHKFGDFVEGYNTVEIVRKGADYSFYFNGILHVLGTYKKYSSFEELEICALFDQVGFTNFVGQHLSQ